MENTLKLAYEKHEAAVVSRHGASVKYNKRGFCATHPDVQLREKKLLKWEERERYCFKCLYEWLKKQGLNPHIVQTSNGRFRVKLSQQNTSKPTWNVAGLVPTTVTQEPEIRIQSHNQGPLPIVPNAAEHSPVVPVFDNSFVFRPRHPLVDKLKSASTPPQISDALKEIAGIRDSDTQTRGQVGVAGGAEVIVKAMAMYIRDEDVQFQGCGAFRNLAFNVDENRALINWSGGIAGILGAMKEHPNAPWVQEEACRALGNLSFGDSVNRFSIAESGGIAALLSAMQRHPGEASVQEQACGLIRNLAMNGKIALSIVQSHGITATLMAMKGHPNSVRVQEGGCAALCNLARQESRTFIGQSGGVTAILQAMQGHPNEASLQEQGCRALWNLSIDNVANKAMIVRSGGDAAIQKAMQTHPRDRNIQCVGRAALVSFR